MISKQQLLDSMRHETGIIKHLFTCIPDGRMDYRPSEEQRSLEELLRYLTASALSPAIYSQSGNWDHAMGLNEETQAFDLGRFPEEMDQQLSRIEDTLAAVTDEDLGVKEIEMPWKAPCMLGEGLMNMCVKTLTAYRMQLFLYVKAAGNNEIGSMDCWVGAPAKPA